VQGIEQVAPGGKLLAIIVRAHVASEKKYNFLTDSDSSLQLGVSNYPGGEVIPAHVHLRPEVTVPTGIEYILVKSGRLRVKLYDGETREQLSVQELAPGDSILLIAGGHGFDVLEPCQILEVKQGPYLSKEKDKVVWDT
jgi:hypothetical protein